MLLHVLTSDEFRSQQNETKTEEYSIYSLTNWNKDLSGKLPLVTFISQNNVWSRQGLLNNLSSLQETN